MKKIIKIIAILIIIFFALIIISPELLAFCIMGILSCGIIFSIIFVVNKLISMLNTLQSKDTAKKNQEKAQKLLVATVKHVVGLPVAENSFCTLKYIEDCIKIESGNSVFNLPLEKIADMTTTTEVDIQRQYVSSVGGAVGGLVLFGPLGAMVGGRAKKKENKTTTNYFIITYKDNEEIKYISFNSTGCFKIYKFIERFRSRDHAAVEINL